MPKLFEGDCAGDSSGNWTPATTLETRKTAGVWWSTVITGRLTDDHQSFGGLNERRPAGNGFTFNFLCQDVGVNKTTGARYRDFFETKK